MPLYDSTCSCYLRGTLLFSFELARILRPAKLIPAGRFNAMNSAKALAETIQYAPVFRAFNTPASANLRIRDADRPDFSAAWRKDRKSSLLSPRIGPYRCHYLQSGAIGVLMLPNTEHAPTCRG
jgi:hypothetical protein